jgi:hypothetical protein
MCESEHDDEENDEDVFQKPRLSIQRLNRSDDPSSRANCGQYCHELILPTHRCSLNCTHATRSGFRPQA